MIKCRIRIATVIALMVPAASVRGQQPQAQKPAASNVFQQVFPSPTGQNGYEDMVRAGDLAKNSAVWQAVELAGGQLTLAEKRRVLSDPAVHKALMILREGLRKPIKSPHPTADDQTLFPELALMRSLARLLAVEIYVQFADGHTGQAIDSLADALHFGYSIQSDTLIGGLVGVAIDAIGIRSISDHVDQLDARDCDRLVMLARQWLGLPDPLIAVIAAERDVSSRILTKYRSQPEKLIESVGGVSGGNTPRLRVLAGSLRESPDSGGPAIDEAVYRLNGFYGRVIEMLKKPVWERTDVEMPADDSLAGVFVNLIAPVAGAVMDRYGREQAQVQLLGVQAAIRRYRWEFNRLPDSLEALKLGNLAIDPFTGQPFMYKAVDEKTYTLSSIGPKDRSEGAAPGTRVLIK